MDTDTDATPAIHPATAFAPDNNFVSGFSKPSRARNPLVPNPTSDGEEEEEEEEDLLDDMYRGVGNVEVVIRRNRLRYKKLQWELKKMQASVESVEELRAQLAASQCEVKLLTERLASISTIVNQ